ncbi:NAD(P)H-dependent oxidoreductase [Flammeovirga sp. EKP202]|uniref:NAD(P)H-dependent oxidoreductase n=1 Tax=Flammeovirga sp. EKP202 TaxID=2770592 RepID=UPI00165F8807|nr:NAD(P)H-dependent oxidoreductase [Flammeovirga sp. EKP202]MBD0400591.1 NAD(P)H-dependent oxidoreductase [Flammeovirga sp. EKP202]
MNVFIVYAHPSKKSFTYQVLKQLIEGLKEAKHSIEISDLYEMDFISDMSEEEYEREGFGRKDMPIPNDVKIEHEKIERADAIIFLYPLWWSDVPAKLKGWFDRVYTVGYAYGYDSNRNKIRKMKQIDKGLSICTAGHPNEYLEKIGIAQSIRNIMLDDRLGGRFKEKQQIILGGTLDPEKVKENHLERAFSIGKTL